MTILNEFQVFPPGYVIVAAIDLGVALLITILTIMMVIDKLWERSDWKQIIWILIFMIVGTINLIAAYNHRIMRYEVIFNDDISINEIYEQYKVVEHRGDIFTIEERANK